jgi:hypothetical protein
VVVKIRGFMVMDYGGNPYYSNQQFIKVKCESNHINCKQYVYEIII